MSAQNKNMHNIGGKLGIEDSKVFSKATEYERLLQNKSTAGSNMTDTSKLVVCLDLACELYNIDFNMKMAAVYSGLKQSAYKNCRKIVQNLLQLNVETTNLSALCVTLNCSSVQTQAEKIIAEYKKQCKQAIDLNLPQYICMAVYHACRLNKVKVSKSKLIEKSRLKPTQWTKLDAEWSKFVSENFAKEVKQGNSKIYEDTVEIRDVIIDTKNEEKMCEENENEDYEVWKARILELAYKDLGVTLHDGPVLHKVKKKLLN